VSGGFHKVNHITVEWNVDMIQVLCYAVVVVVVVWVKVNRES